MRHIWLTPIAVISFLRCANAQDAPSDIPGFPSDHDSAPAQPAQAEGYTLDTPIEKLATDPAAAAVVDKAIPGLLEDDRYPVFKDMSLNAVASLSHGQITDDMLAEAAEGLKTIPAKMASDAEQADWKRQLGVSPGQSTLRRLIGR